MPDETTDEGKIANLLALMVTKEMSRSQTVITLVSCGFTTREIAALTGSAENSVRAMISQARKKATDG